VICRFPDLVPSLNETELKEPKYSNKRAIQMFAHYAAIFLIAQSSIVLDESSASTLHCGILSMQGSPTDFRTYPL
jgi:hypothetical protein